jgi:hypothetical protein
MHYQMIAFAVCSQNPKADDGLAIRAQELLRTENSHNKIRFQPYRASGGT